MIRKILPLLLPVLALVGGIAAGTAMTPTKPDKGDAHAAAAAGDGHGAPAEGKAADDHGAAKDDHAAPAKDDHAAPAKDDGHGAAAKDDGHGKGGKDDGHGGEKTGPGWFTFPGQFFVPLARNGDMGAMMIITLVLETDAASLGALERQEHRLRDALLRQLLIHANTGGFDGNFTVDRNLQRIREDLLQAARASTDVTIDAVLIEDIVRQGG